MYRFDGFPDVLHRYSMESSIYDSGMLIPDYDLAEKYQYNGLFSKIIDRPAEEALKHGIEYNISDQTLADFLDDALDRLDWEEKATTAIRWARLFGGAVIVMLLDDGRVWKSRSTGRTSVRWKSFVSMSVPLFSQTPIVT